MKINPVVLTERIPDQNGFRQAVLSAQYRMKQTARIVFWCRVLILAAVLSIGSVACSVVNSDPAPVQAQYPLYPQAQWVDLPEGRILMLSHPPEPVDVWGLPVIVDDGVSTYQPGVYPAPGDSREGGE